MRKEKLELRISEQDFQILTRIAEEGNIPPVDITGRTDYCGRSRKKIFPEQGYVGGKKI